MRSCVLQKKPTAKRIRMKNARRQNPGDGLLHGVYNVLFSTISLLYSCFRLAMNFFNAFNISVLVLFGLDSSVQASGKGNRKTQTHWLLNNSLHLIELYLS